MAENPGKLPDFVAPMLCKQGEAFDSDDWLFEIKWDGVRALAFVDESGQIESVRIRNRRGTLIQDRYPDLREALATLPSGTILDGEIIVVGDDGMPDFSRVLQREQGQGGERLRSLVRKRPACFVAFDQLFDGGIPILDLPLRERRTRLEALDLASRDARLMFSDGIHGSGIDYFTRVREQGLEGIVAKRLDSTYAPGKRLDAWRKIKVSHLRACVVIGWLESGKRDLRSLLVATDFEDGAGLRYVGKVGSGLPDALRSNLLQRLTAREIEKPIVQCSEKGRFVEPEIYVLVRYLEISKGGRFRAPVFESLVDA